MKFELIVAAIKSVADLFRMLFGRSAKKEEEKRDAVDKTTAGIGKGKTFILVAILSSIILVGCGYVHTVSTPLVFDPNDYRDLSKGEEFVLPKDGVYFSDKALEVYIRSKIAEYEIRKRGFFHREGTEK